MKMLSFCSKGGATRGNAANKQTYRLSEEKQ